MIVIKLKYSVTILVTLLLIIVGLCSFQVLYLDKINKTELVKKNIDKKEKNEKVTFSASGDVLLHQAVLNEYFINNTFDFKPMFSNIDSYIHKDYNF